MLNLHQMKSKLCKFDIEAKIIKLILYIYEKVKFKWKEIVNLK